MFKASLMTRILLAASVIVLFAFASFSYYIDTLQRSATEREIGENIKSSGEQAATSIANWLNGRVLLTSMVAETIGKQQTGAPVVDVLKNKVLSAEFMSTYMGDEVGGFAIWPQQDLPADFDPRKRPWYKLAVRENVTVLTEPYREAGDGKLVIGAAVPVFQQNKLIGVTASDISLDTLVKMISAIDLGGQGEAFLVNSEGKILIHSNAGLIEKRLADAFPAETPILGSDLSYTSYENKPVLVSFVPVKGLPSVSWYVGFIIDSDKAFAGLGAFRLAAAVATILAIGCMIAAMAWLLHGIVIRPVTQMTTTMQSLAKGELNVDVPSRERRDQIGSMASAVEVFKLNAIERQRLEIEADRNRNFTDAERRDREIERNNEASEVRHVVEALADALGSLADGNLAYRIDRSFASSFDRLRTDYNTAASKLHRAMNTVGGKANAIDVGAADIRAAADGLALRTQQQSASVEETAAALEQLTTTVKDTARRAEEAGILVARTRHDAEASGSVVGKAVAAMNDIQGSSEKIEDIIEVIDGIAFQTNLLALNAGVEAARAGEAGKGFAVVAQEVRELAQRSAKAAKEIEGLIISSKSQVENGANLVGEAGKALQAIVGQVFEINQHVGAIVTASREQSLGLQEINVAVNTMDQGTQQNAAMVEEQTAASHDLAAEAAQLLRLLEQFHLSDVADWSEAARHAA